MNVPGNPLAGAIYGMTALSFVYTFDAVVVEQNFPAAIVGLVPLAHLNNPAPNNRGTNNRPNETVEEASLRHLRSCFAHGRFVIGGPPNNPQITLDDFNQAGNQTFHAQCAAANVFELAERVLVEAHNIASNIAHAAAAPGAPAGAGAGAPAAAAPSGAPPSAGAPAGAPAAAAGAAPAAGNPGGGGGYPPPPWVRHSAATCAHAESARFRYGSPLHRRGTHHRRARHHCPA